MPEDRRGTTESFDQRGRVDPGSEGPRDLPVCLSSGQRDGSRNQSRINAARGISCAASPRDNAGSKADRPPHAATSHDAGRRASGAARPGVSGGSTAPHGSRSRYSPSQAASGTGRTPRLVRRYGGPKFDPSPGRTRRAPTGLVRHRVLDRQRLFEPEGRLSRQQRPSGRRTGHRPSFPDARASSTYRSEAFGPRTSETSGRDRGEPLALHSLQPPITYRLGSRTLPAAAQHSPPQRARVRWNRIRTRDGRGRARLGNRNAVVPAARAHVRRPAVGTPSSTVAAITILVPTRSSGRTPEDCADRDRSLAQDARPHCAIGTAVGSSWA